LLDGPGVLAGDADAEHRRGDGAPDEAVQPMVVRLAGLGGALADGAAEGLDVDPLLGLGRAGSAKAMAGGIGSTCASDALPRRARGPSTATGARGQESIQPFAREWVTADPARGSAGGEADCPKWG